MKTESLSIEAQEAAARSGSKYLFRRFVYTEIPAGEASEKLHRAYAAIAAHKYLRRNAHKARARVFLTMLTIHGFCAILAGGFAACGVWPMAAGCLAVVLVMQSEIRKGAR